MHQHLVSLSHLPIGLSMVRWHPNCPYAHKLTKLSDDVAFKVGSSVTQELGQCSEDWDISLPQKLSNSFCNLIRGHICHNMFCKVFTKTKHFTTFVGLSNSTIVSMLIKSMCSNSKDAVKKMGCTGTLAWVPSCWMHCLELLIAFCICVVIPGHQNWSCSKYHICCCPWCPASQWHPFMAAAWWAVGTTNCKTSSKSPVDVWQW